MTLGQAACVLHAWLGLAFRAPFEDSISLLHLPLPPETGAALESVQPLLVQYTQRCPAGAPQPDEEEMAGWAATLRHEALGATAALRRAVEALRAEAEVGGTASGSPEMQDSDSAGQEQDSLGEGSLAAALQQVAAGIDAAEAALRAAPLDAGAAHLLQQCAARLSQLLGAGGVGDGV